MQIGRGQITVVVPTFNEEVVDMVLDEVGAAGYENVLVVDGYSVDGTAKVAECWCLLRFVGRREHQSENCEDCIHSCFQR